MARDILKDPPLYKTRFEVAARVYQPTEADAKEAHASLDRLKGLMPESFDPDAHPTLLYVVGNLFVGNTLNRNDDAVTLEDTLRMYRGFEIQQINVEHSRGSVVGVIVRAGLAEFGTDRLITEDEARAAGKPVNVAIVVALWKVVDRDLVSYILQADAEGKQDSLSFSFEVGFDAYSIITLPKGVINLAAATRTIAPSAPDFAQWDARLRVNKGSGVSRGGERVGRVLTWPIIPMGGGVVAMPAGAVKGIAPITSGDAQGAEDEEVVEAGMYEYSSTQCTLSASDAAPFLAFAASIPDEQLYAEEERYGREDEPHVTALYGIKGGDAAPIQLALQGCGPIRATLGKVSAFTNEDKPYDVLKVDVISEDLCRAHALLKATCDHEETHPHYHPHLTIAYVRKGAAAAYVGDARFEGMALTFPSLTFSPAEGNREEIWLEQPTIPPGPIASAAEPAQTEPQPVYSVSEPTDVGTALASMSTPSRTLKLSAGWQEKLAALAADKPVTDTAGAVQYDMTFPRGLDVTLSDGRTIKAMKVVDAATLGTDIEVSYDGVVITSMTPGVAAPEYVPPGKTDIYPTKDAAAQATDAANVAQQQKATKEGYTGASVNVADAVVLMEAADLSFKQSVAALTVAMNAFARSPLSTNTALAGVSPSTTTPTQPMDLNTLKQAVAAVKSVEDLPTVMANVASFVDIIAKASEEQVAARAAAETAAKTAQATLADVQSKLDALTTSHNAIIAAQQAAAAEQVLQTRLAAIDEVFAFDDETRADILPEVKALADDAAFASWMPRAKRLYKGYLKAAQTAAAFPPKDEKKEKDEDKKSEDCKAAAQTAIASAAANVTDAAVHNSVEVTEKSLKERYAAILSKGVSIGGASVADLTAASLAVKKTR